MFKGLLPEASSFKASMQAISQIIDEAVFRFKEDGIELIAADRAKVAAIDFKMSREMFETYECEGEMKVGLNLPMLLKVLKRVSKTESLEMEIDEKENRVKLTAIGKTRRTFYLPILDLSEEELPPIEKLQFSAEVEVDTDTVKEAVEDASAIADSIVFQASEEGFTMYAESESSKMEVKLGPEEAEIKGEGKARYPLDYLKKFIKAAGIADRAKIKFGTDYPMKMEFEGINIYLALVLAPRVEE